MGKAVQDRSGELQLEIPERRYVVTNKAEQMGFWTSTHEFVMRCWVESLFILHSSELNELNALTLFLFLLFSLHSIIHYTSLFLLIISK
jgi:hypothetical protein